MSRIYGHSLMIGGKRLQRESSSTNWWLLLQSAPDGSNNSLRGVTRRYGLVPLMPKGGR